MKTFIIFCLVLLRRKTLQPGDGIFLFTDGVTEAMDSTGKMYSEERLVNFLANQRDFNPEDIIRATLPEIVNFSSGTPQADDITVMAIKVSG